MADGSRQYLGGGVFTGVLNPPAGWNGRAADKLPDYHLGVR